MLARKGRLLFIKVVFKILVAVWVKKNLTDTFVDKVIIKTRFIVSLQFSGANKRRTLFFDPKN